MKRSFPFLIAVGVLFWAGTLFAKPVPVLVDLGVAPAVHYMNGPVADDNPFHTGLKLSLHGIIDRETIQQNRKRVPKKYRSMVDKVESVRISPFWYLPDTLFISPPLATDSQAYGVTFRPMGIGLSVGETLRLGIGIGPILSYIYLDNGGGTAYETTHFIRPGADGNVDLEVKFARGFALSFGWTSQVYIPQDLGEFGWNGKNVEQSVWHIGQAYAMFHFRFDQEINP